MLSLHSNDLGRRATWICISCSASSRIGPSIAATQRHSQRRAHERRHSSSKASSSSKQEPGSIAATAESSSKTTNGDHKSVPARTLETQEKRPSSRIGRRRARDNGQEAENKLSRMAQMSLPSVPSTQNLHPLNIQLASFFSAHRPLSITNAIPPSTSDAAFSSLFETRRNSRHTSRDVIHTLSSALDNLENAAYSQEEQDTRSQHPGSGDVDLYTAVAQASQSEGQSAADADLPAKTFHMNLQELAKSFKPYSPPPPPVPMGALQEIAGASTKLTRAEKRKQQRPLEEKTYRTTITIYETIYANGKRTYEAHSSPLVADPSAQRPAKSPQLPSPQALTENSGQQDGQQHLPHLTSDQVPSRFTQLASFLLPPYQPFLSRMYVRRLGHEHRLRERYLGEDSNKIQADAGQMIKAEGGEDTSSSSPSLWQLISVKRQRKLKMKKHKYKKLMKRTRNLRRRLDRQ